MKCLVFRYAWSYIYTMNDGQNNSQATAGTREPLRQVRKCRTRNSNNRRSECKVKADALHDRYGRRIERADNQRNARKAKRAARMK